MGQVHTYVKAGTLKFLRIHVLQYSAMIAHILCKFFI